MDDEQSLLNEPERNDAAEAFARLEARVAGLEERLEGRLALMTRTLEHIALERQSLDVPDYGPTLAKMNAHLASIVGQTKAMQESPALRLTPKSMAAEIATAATTARDTDKAMIAKALEIHRQAHADVTRSIGKIRTKAEQGWYTAYCILSTALIVSLLWLIYPGWAAAIGARSWHWPERVAQRTLGEESLWAAGSRLMRTANPDQWQAIADAVERKATCDKKDTTEKLLAARRFDKVKNNKTNLSKSQNKGLR